MFNILFIQIIISKFIHNKTPMKILNILLVLVTLTFSTKCHLQVCEAGNNVCGYIRVGLIMRFPLEGTRDKQKACTCLFRSGRSFAISQASRMRRKGSCKRTQHCWPTTPNIVGPNNVVTCLSPFAWNNNSVSTCWYLWRIV